MELTLFQIAVLVILSFILGAIIYKTEKSPKSDHDCLDYLCDPQIGQGRIIITPDPFDEARKLDLLYKIVEDETKETDANGRFIKQLAQDVLDFSIATNGNFQSAKKEMATIRAEYAREQAMTKALTASLNEVRQYLLDYSELLKSGLYTTENDVKLMKINNIIKEG